MQWRSGLLPGLQRYAAMRPAMPPGGTSWSPQSAGPPAFDAAQLGPAPLAFWSPSLLLPPPLEDREWAGLPPLTGVRCSLTGDSFAAVQSAVIATMAAALDAATARLRALCMRAIQLVQIHSQLLSSAAYGEVGQGSREGMDEERRFGKSADRCGVETHPVVRAMLLLSQLRESPLLAAPAGHGVDQKH